MEKVHILHFFVWSSFWICGSHEASRFVLNLPYIPTKCLYPFYGLWLAKIFFLFVIFLTDFDKTVSPISVAHFSQYKLMNLLLQRLEKLGFSVCSPSEIEGSIWDRKILMGHECISIHPTNEGLKVGTSYLKEGKMEEREFHCSILVGSDGARSTVRKLVDIDMKGERNLQRLVSVHFLSKDLGQYLLHERPGMLFFIFNPDAIGVLVAHDLDQGEFVLQVEQLMLKVDLKTLI